VGLPRLGGRGVPFVLSGRTLTTEGAPLPGLVLDVWHTSPRGRYGVFDRAMRYRGRLRTGPDGAWSVRTTLPGGYVWRPPHVHVKVWDGGRLRLTTQLYLPGDWRLGVDPHPRPELILRLERTRDGTRARYDLVLPP
jgi:protocatechuate 3,4-dioxygenase beta subunit